jgi:hypothetical protein
MTTPVNLMGAKAACIVADRAHADAIRSFCEQQGGGWMDGYRVWSGLPEMQYLVLLADKPLRMRKRAPLVMLGRDQDGLQKALAEACARLDDVVCLWVPLLESDASEIVGKLILADSKAGGTA